MIQVSRPSIGEEELQEVCEVFKTGWLGMGGKVKEFEEAIIKLLGNSNRTAIAVNTGSTALHLALDSLGIKRGDEVITPSLTFIASLQAITAVGAKPVFCDIEPDTLNISLKDTKKKITRRTKAIIPVHYRGQPCDMDGLLGLGRDNKITIVEDAAHAFGSKYKNKMIGSFGDITVFSFDPIKNITCGEGGVIITDDPKLVKITHQKRIMGIDNDTWSRYRNERNWFYDVLCQGYRYHMSNINAAIGLAQLKKLDKFISRKREIAMRYDREFSGIKEIQLLTTDYENTSLFMYIIKAANNRDQLMDHLKQNGIGSGIHYIPSHIFTYCRKYKTRLPVTERAYQQIITLPLYYDMSDLDVGAVIKAVKDFFKC